MIELNHVNKKYGRNQILNDVCLCANAGQSIAIVGKNGCGKSTLLQIMAGILSPDAGSIRYFDQDVLKNKKCFKKYCGYVPQDNPLLEELSVKDNLRLWGWNSKHPHNDLLQQLELYDILDKSVSCLSGGMKRRVSIACAVFLQPSLVLLDEPTTALDVYHKDKVQSWITDYCKGNGIVIMTTHDEKEIMSADRCMIMLDGKLVELTDKTERWNQIRAYIMEK